ncbi:MAG: DUF2384 domain-containing protein [Alphaproteobacteria bacterium]|nr:DUF2384 domain-containing protein [Alphaproteobacteria bacterium]
MGKIEKYLIFLLTKIMWRINRFMSACMRDKDWRNVKQKQQTATQLTKIGADMPPKTSAQTEMVRPELLKENIERTGNRFQNIFQRAKRVNVSEGDALLTKATLNIGKRLAISDNELRLILGVKESELPDLRAQKTGLHILDTSGNATECAILLGKIYIYLDYIVNNNDKAACSWLRNHNTKLDGKPIEIIMTKNGLENVASYLEQRYSFL